VQINDLYAAIVNDEEFAVKRRAGRASFRKWHEKGYRLLRILHGMD
jgi:hypothetical protein